MIDKIVVISDTEALIVFTNCPAKRLTASDGIRSFLGWFLSPQVTITYGEYRIAVVANVGDTQPMIKAVA